MFFSSSENMLVISSTFPPLGQPDNTDLGGNESCHTQKVEFAISFQFSMIRELKGELLCFLTILLRKQGLERQNVFTVQFLKITEHMIKT